MAYTTLDANCWLGTNSVYLPRTCGHDAPRIRYRNELHVRFDDHEHVLPSKSATNVRPLSYTNGQTTVGYQTESSLRNVVNSIGDYKTPYHCAQLGSDVDVDVTLDVNGNLKQAAVAPASDQIQNQNQSDVRCTSSSSGKTLQPMRYRPVRHTTTSVPTDPRQTLESRFGALRNMQNQTALVTCLQPNGLQTRANCDSLPTHGDRLPTSNQRHPSANSAKSLSRADTLNSACSATLTQTPNGEWHFCGTRCQRSHQPSLPEYARPRHFHTPKLLRDAYAVTMTRSAYGQLPSTDSDSYAAFERLPRSATCNFAHGQCQTTLVSRSSRKPIVTRSPTSGALEVNDARFAYMIASQPHSVRNCNAIPLTLASAEAPMGDCAVGKHQSTTSAGSTCNRVHIVDTPKIVTVPETADESESESESESASLQECTNNVADSSCTNNADALTNTHTNTNTKTNTETETETKVGKPDPVRPLEVPSIVIDQSNACLDNRENPFLPNGCLHREADQLIRQSVFKRDPDGKLHVLQTDKPPSPGSGSLADQAPPDASGDANALVDTSVSIIASVACMQPIAIATPDRHAPTLCANDKSQYSPPRTPHALSNGNAHATKADAPDEETHLTSSKSAPLQAAPAERRDPTETREKKKKKKKKRCSLM